MKVKNILFVCFAILPSLLFSSIELNQDNSCESPYVISQLNGISDDVNYSDDYSNKHSKDIYLSFKTNVDGNFSLELLKDNDKKMKYQLFIGSSCDAWTLIEKPTFEYTHNINLAIQANQNYIIKVVKHSNGNSRYNIAYRFVADDSFEDMGYLVESNTTQTDNQTKIQLSVNLLYDKDLVFDLKELKICNDKRCWGVIDSFTNKDLNSSNKESSLVGDKIRVVNLGLFDIYDTDHNFTNSDDYIEMIKSKNIDRIKFIYNNKKGEVKLPTEMSFILPKRGIFIKLDSNLSVPLSSIYYMTGGDFLHIPHISYKHEFTNGVILDIPQGALDQMALVAMDYYESVGAEKEYFYFNNYSISFYSKRTNLSLEENLYEFLESGKPLNRISKYFSKNIGIYLPIKKSDITKESLLQKFKFSKGDNQGYSEDFEIVTMEDKKYLYFETNLTTLRPVFRRVSGVY